MTNEGNGLRKTSLEVEYQRRLTDLWEKNLDIPVSPEADYFESGGDSLRGTQLLTWIQESFGIELSLLDIFECRTIPAQAALLASRAPNEKHSGTKVMTAYRYFGRGPMQLFGALHYPQAKPTGTGVILCYPMGQEYMRIHRTYVELAKSLAAAGSYVFRFDYFGSGDSSGDPVSGNLEQWAQDIQEAIRELRASTGVRQIHLVGARIGANLALATGGGGQVASIVVWEPILNGTDYLAALKQAHHNLLAGNACLEGYEWHTRPGCAAELIGFPISQKLLNEITGIDPTTFPEVPERSKVLFLANSRKKDLEQYVSGLKGRLEGVSYLVAEESDAIWLKEDRQNKGLIPHKAVQAIVSWIAERAA